MLFPYAIEVNPSSGNYTCGVRPRAGLPWWLSGKESTCQCRRCRYNPWVGNFPWKRKWQPTPVFLPGKSHGQRSLGATVHGVSKSQTGLSALRTHTHASLQYNAECFHCPENPLCSTCISPSIPPNPWQPLIFLLSPQFCLSHNFIEYIVRII